LRRRPPLSTGIWAESHRRRRKRTQERRQLSAGLPGQGPTGRLSGPGTAPRAQTSETEDAATVTSGQVKSLFLGRSLLVGPQLARPKRKATECSCQWQPKIERQQPRKCRSHGFACCSFLESSFITRSTHSMQRRPALTRRPPWGQWGLLADLSPFFEAKGETLNAVAFAQRDHKFPPTAFNVRSIQWDCGPKAGQGRCLLRP
jgi:hypothetical protein